MKFHTIKDLPKAHRPRLLNNDMINAIEDSLRSDELTARKLKETMARVFPNLPNVSISTMKHYRKKLGWVCTRPHYCQLVREANEEKRKTWCQAQINNQERFEDVILTDECTVQLDSHGRLCFRKEKEGRTLKQCPKHPVKVHIWGGISLRGATCLVMFTGIMNAVRYGKILESSLVPLFNTFYPNGHRLQQDNDLKHSSKFV